VLIIFGGLPGTGKTTIARELARQIGATHLRIDSIEQAMRDASPKNPPVRDEGYRVAYAVAEDNLRIGRTVVADSVNPLSITRDAWLEVGRRAKVTAIEVEVVCSDPAQHRRRVETRQSDILGLQLPTWEQVTLREYHPWSRQHIVIDTATQTVDQAVRFLREALPRQ
jgi:predicted kinase